MACLDLSNMLYRRPCSTDNGSLKIGWHYGIFCRDEIPRGDVLVCCASQGSC